VPITLVIARNNRREKACSQRDSTVRSIFDTAETDMGWVHPWAGLGWVGSGWVDFLATVVGWIVLGWVE